MEKLKGILLQLGDLDRAIHYLPIFLFSARGPTWFD